MRSRAALALFALLAGCNLAPRYAAPVAPIPSAFPAPPMQTAPELAWGRYFGDPRLRALIADALANNRGLAQAVARVAQARARFGIATAARLPEISAQEFSRTGLLSNFQGPHILTVQTADFEIDFWGRVRNLAEARRHAFLAEAESERAFRVSLVGQVAATYFQLIESRERIALAERVLTGRLQNARTAGRQVAAGVGAGGIAEQATILVGQAQTELAELRRRRANAENFLMVLVGGPDRPAAGGAPIPGLPLDDPRQVGEVDPGLPSALLANRPDIRREEQLLRAADADIGAARAAFLPSLSLSAAGGFLSPSLKALLDRDNAGYQATAAALLPIFDFGRRRAGLRLTRAQAAERAASYQLTTQQAFREVADALIARQQLIDQTAAQARTVVARRRLVRLAGLGLAGGLVSQLDMLDAERDLFVEEQRRIALRGAQLQTAVSLYVALGGGPRDF